MIEMLFNIIAAIMMLTLAFVALGAVLFIIATAIVYVAEIKNRRKK